MDSSLLKTLLSNVSTIAKDTNTTDKDVKNVLTSALPYLMKGNKTTAKENQAISAETGIDTSAVSSIVTTALPYVKEALKNIDTDKISSAVSKLSTPENLKKAADLAGKFLKNKN